VTASLIDRILGPGGLTVRFQPIVRVENGRSRVHGFEGLVRGPAGSTVEPADVLFDYVRRKREEVAVDRACIAAILAAARGLADDVRLSVNVHALTLARDSSFVDFILRHLETHAIEPARLTVEIVEHAHQWAGPALMEALRRMRALGVRVALDDVGQGQSNFRMIVDCQPDYLKLDAYFVRGVQHDPFRQAVLQSVAVLAARLGGEALAEGIEEKAEFETALALGISLFQGFYFATPGDSPRVDRWAPTLDETFA
jgi:EAL domain-containing protein (putative c-di-GMP-specific phosphodiesterase class I)